jgi:hypothetical protein
MDAPALADLIVSLVDDLIQRDRAEATHLYVVNGTYADDVPQITADFVVAASEEEAAERIEGIRGLDSGGWTRDLTYLHLKDIRSAVAALKVPASTHDNDLATMLNEFGGKICVGCQKPFGHDALDPAGRCTRCRRRVAKRSQTSRRGANRN